MSEELKGTTCVTFYNGRFYRIEEINESVTPITSFTDKAGKEYSYIQYYKMKYNIQIKDENQPMIKAIEKRGRMKEEITIWLVPELCFVTGLTDGMRADFNLMKRIAETTKPRPQDRVGQASKFIETIVKDNLKIMEQWGLKIEKEPITIETKQLNPGGMIMEGGKKRIDIIRDNLDRDTQTQMYEQVPLTNWAVVASEQDSQVVDFFMNTMRECIEFCKYPANAPHVVYV